MLVNEGLPTYIVSKLKLQYPLRQERVGILGMAFKANSDDKRESLSYKLKKILEIEAKQVLCSDVYIEEEGFVSAEELVRRCDIIILGVPHREYKTLGFAENKHVVDVWNFYNQGGLIQ
jgi:UDP-N-acetyl-D-mannosaminuronic acid dehydrogenase